MDARSHPSPSDYRQSIELALRPGTLTAVVSSSGVVNLAVAMPSLLDLLGGGHKVVVCQFGDIGDGLGGIFDFIGAQGPRYIERLKQLLNRRRPVDREALKDLVGPGLGGLYYVDGPQRDREWLSDLQPSDTGRPSVLLIPDLQECLPLRDWLPKLTLPRPVSNFTLMPAQLVGLKLLARCGGVAVVGGHCASAGVEVDWRVMAGIADETIVVQESKEVQRGRFTVQLARFRAEAPDLHPAGEESGTAELGFAAWRGAR